MVVRDPNGHLANIAGLLDNPRYADMEVVARGTGGTAVQRFACHRAILAARSSYFDRMFFSGEPNPGRHSS